MTPFDWIDDRLAGLDAAHLRRALVQRENAPAAIAEIGGQRLINFGSNDYLGLARDPRLMIAVTRAMQQYGWGSGSSPLITGHSNLHRDLEVALATFEGAEAAVLFPTGFAANVGVLTALTSSARGASPGAKTIIYSDSKNHASIIDGCRLSGAAVEIYRHNDPGHLASLLKQPPIADDVRRLIVTDTLFSMDGDLAPLAELTQLAESHGAMLVADEAHATGVLGAQGRGACEHFAIESSALIRVGTLSKALGSLGGFVVGPQKVIDWIINASRPLIYSTAAPAAVCAAGLTALDIVQSEPERRIQVLKLAEKLRTQLRGNGWDCGDSTTQIVPVRIGDPAATMAMSSRLRDRGILAPGIRPPSVPDGESLLRISLSFDHEEAMVDELISVIGKK